MGVSQWVSESVTDKHNQWSDSGPIKTWYVSFLPDPSSPNHHFFLLSKLIIVYLIGQQTTWYLVKSTTCSPFLVHPWCLKALYPRIYINNNDSMQIWYQSRQSTLNKQKACELIRKPSSSMCGTQALKRNTKAGCVVVTNIKCDLFKIKIIEEKLCVSYKMRIVGKI